MLVNALLHDAPALPDSSYAILSRLLCRHWQGVAALLATGGPHWQHHHHGISAAQTAALLALHETPGFVLAQDVPWPEGMAGEGPLFYAGHCIGAAGEQTVAGLLLTQPPSQALQAELADFTALAAHQMRATRARDTEQLRLSQAVAGSGTGIWDRNIQTGEIYYSAGWKAILGYADHEVGNRIEESYQRLHPDEIDYVKEAMRDHFEGRSNFYHVEHRLLCRDGSYRWVASRGRIVAHDEAGRPLRMMGTTIDITERKLAEAQLREQATTDSLTRLPNRRHLMQSIEARWRQQGQPHAEPVAVLMLDLDHFKAINDLYGHAVGDQALRHFAILLREALGPQDNAGRMGGEEFAVVLGCSSQQAALAFALRIQAGTAMTPLPAGARALTASIGITLMLANDPDPEAALSRSDKALYRAKALGRDRIEWG